MIYGGIFDMLSAIFLLTGVMFLGYFLGVRNPKQSQIETEYADHVKDVNSQQTVHKMIATNAYRIGLVFLFVGFLIQLAHFDIPLFESMNDFFKIITTIITAIVLFFIGKYIVDKIGKHHLEKYDGCASK